MTKLTVLYSKGTKHRVVWKCRRVDFGVSVDLEISIRSILAWPATNAMDNKLLPSFLVEFTWRLIWGHSSHNFPQDFCSDNT